MLIYYGLNLSLPIPSLCPPPPQSSLDPTRGKWREFVDWVHAWMRAIVYSHQHSQGPGRAQWRRCWWRTIKNINHCLSHWSWYQRAYTVNMSINDFEEKSTIIIIMDSKCAACVEWLFLWWDSWRGQCETAVLTIKVRSDPQKVCLSAAASSQL